MKYTEEELMESATKNHLFSGIDIALDESIASHLRYKGINHVTIYGDMYKEGEGIEAAWFPDYEPFMNFSENANQALLDIFDYIWKHGSCKVDILYEHWTKESNERELIHEYEAELKFDEMVELGHRITIIDWT